MKRTLIVGVGLLLLGAIGWSVVWLGLYARRSVRQGRWFPAGLAGLVAVGVLALTIPVVDMIGFALFWES